ncbi:MAG TPA: hypothetical protein VN811_05900, partial [Thermoanaerobaculia bacterium]|nr:hypothetical protein [Thermoanaerobaculia bacterium]
MAVAALRRRVFGMRRLNALLPGLFLGSLLIATPAAANLYWVGNNGNPPCTHANLQAAIDDAVGSAGFDLIYLVGAGPFNGPFLVLGGDLEIHG